MTGKYPKASDLGLASCAMCGMVAPVVEEACPRCHSQLHLRKPASITRTMALMIAAVALYIPSHLLPILTTSEIGVVTHNTIVGGMVTFWKTGAYPIAVVIFTASILIPFLKIGALIWLCLAATGKLRTNPHHLGKIYLITELMGRWSMVDIFVVGILVSLVQLGNFMTVLPGPGALAFAGVVVLTMFAAMSFEPRLLWDQYDSRDDDSPQPDTPATS
ncbi:MAG: paraquat-inducible protein A [Verrucomicrobiota bacterium]